MTAHIASHLNWLMSCQPESGDGQNTGFPFNPCSQGLGAACFFSSLNWLTTVHNNETQKMFAHNNEAQKMLERESTGERRQAKHWFP